MGGDPAAAERACRATSTDSQYFFWERIFKEKKSLHQIWGQEAAGSLMFARLKMWDAHDHNGLHPNVLSALSAAAHCSSLLYCLRLLKPEKVVMWCCLQDVFGGAWDFCAAKFGSDVRNRDKVCVLVRVASICSSRLHSAPLPPRAGRVCVLACSSPACRVGHPCPSAL